MAVSVLCLFLGVPWVGLWSVVVASPRVNVQNFQNPELKRF